MTAPGLAIPLIEFHVGGLTLALPITSVRNVLEYRTPVSIPAPRAGVLGIMWEEGMPIPVLDLAFLLGRSEPSTAFLLVARTESGMLAFPIGRVESMPTLTLEYFVHTGFCHVDIPSRFVRAVGLGEDSNVLVLNLASLDDEIVPRSATGSRA